MWVRGVLGRRAEKSLFFFCPPPPHNTHTHTHAPEQTAKGGGWLRNANDVLGDEHEEGTGIHSVHKFSFAVNGWCIWNSTKGGFNGEKRAVANSQQSVVIQNTLLLIILFQEEQQKQKRKGKKNGKKKKRHVPGREKQEEGRGMTMSY